MLKWLKDLFKYEPYECHDCPEGRAAHAIATEISHSNAPSCGGTEKDILRIIRIGVDLRILEVKNDGIEPDEPLAYTR